MQLQQLKFQRFAWKKKRKKRNKRPANKETKLLSVCGAKRRLTNKWHRSVKEARFALPRGCMCVLPELQSRAWKAARARRTGCSKLNLNLVSIMLTTARLGVRFSPVFIVHCWKTRDPPSRKATLVETRRREWEEEKRISRRPTTLASYPIPLPPSRFLSISRVHP